MKCFTRNFKKLLSHLVFLVSVGLLFSQPTSFANSNVEPYSNRPSIVDIEPVNLVSSSSIEGNLQGIMYTLALVFAAYPESTHFYFLARDAEYAYDMAVLLSELANVSPGRLHLINVSTPLSFDPLLPEYLKTHGIHPESDDGAQKSVFIETGFMGSVPETIFSLYPPQHRSSFDMILMDSDSPIHPGLEGFAAFGNAGNLEHWDHYTKSGTDYLPKKNKIIAVGKPATKSDQSGALKLMGQLKSWTMSHQKTFQNLLNSVDALANGNKNTPLTEDVFGHEPARFEKRIVTDLENIFLQCNFCNATSLASKKSASKELESLGAALKKSQSKGPKKKDLQKNLNSLGTKKVLKYVAESTYSGNANNKDLLNEIYSLIVEDLYKKDDYENFEFLSAIVIPRLVQLGSLDGFKKFTRYGVLLEAEESFERIVSYIGRTQPEVLPDLSEQLVAIARVLPEMDRPGILYKVFFQTILSEDRLYELSDLLAELLFSGRKTLQKISYPWKGYLLSHVPKSNHKKLKKIMKNLSNYESINHLKVDLAEALPSAQTCEHLVSRKLGPQ